MAEPFPSTRITFGPVQICGNISSVLWGVTCMQAYVYVVRSQHDRSLTKALVAVVFCLETMLTAFLWEYFFEETVVRDLGPHWVPDTPWSLIASGTAFIIESALVQAFYAHRVRVISQKIRWAMVSWVAIFSRVVIAMAALTLAGKTSLLMVMLEHRYLIDLSLSLSISVDFWNTAVLCWHLWQARNMAFRSMSDRINTIIGLTLETGVMTFVVALFTLISWAASPLLGLWVGGMLVYGRMYSISLLLSLNNRDFPASPGSIPQFMSQRPSGSAVHFTQTREIEADSIGSSAQSSSKQLPLPTSALSNAVKGEGPFTQHCQ